MSIEKIIQYKKEKNTFSSKKGCISPWKFSLLAGMSASIESKINVSMLGQFSIHNWVKQSSLIEFPAKLQNLESFGRSLSSNLFRLGNKVLSILSNSLISIIASRIAQFSIFNSWSCTRSKATDGIKMFLKLLQSLSTTSDFKLLKKLTGNWLCHTSFRWGNSESVKFSMPRNPTCMPINQYISFSFLYN